MSKKQLNSLANRREQLTVQIQKHYDQRDPWTVPRSEASVEKYLMDMFRVVSIKKDLVEFRHLFNDELYSATIPEVDVLQLVHKGDVFLMALIQQDQAWRVWHMSPPYD